MNQANKKAETEVFGVNYERFSLGKKLEHFTKSLGIKTVCEMPAHGAKAAPSLYSLDFALAGCKVTLINGVRDSLKYYKELNADDQIEFLDAESLTQIDRPDSSFDFVWNFAFIPTFPDKDALIKEMMRLSKKHVSIFSVNNLNVGFYLHRFAHWRTKIPWTHGDTKFNNPGFLKKFLQTHGLKNVRLGVVDCPVWPDSVGFRDIRLHRNPVNFEDMQWEVPYIEYKKTNTYPSWFKYVYEIEKFPAPLCIKYLHAHIFYAIGEIDG